MSPVRSTSMTVHPDPQTTKSLSNLRRTVDRVLGSVFYGPLLRTMRNSSLKGKIGHGGRGEEIFQRQLDQLLAERAGQAHGLRSSDRSLSQTLFDRFAPAVAAQSGVSHHKATTE